MSLNLDELRRTRLHLEGNAILGVAGAAEKAELEQRVARTAAFSDGFVVLTDKAPAGPAEELQQKALASLKSVVEATYASKGDRAVFISRVEVAARLGDLGAIVRDPGQAGLEQAFAKFYETVPAHALANAALLLNSRKERGFTQSTFDPDVARAVLAKQDATELKALFAKIAPAAAAAIDSHKGAVRNLVAFEAVHETAAQVVKSVDRLLDQGDATPKETVATIERAQAALAAEFGPILPNLHPRIATLVKSIGDVLEAARKVAAEA